MEVDVFDELLNQLSKKSDTKKSITNDTTKFENVVTKDGLIERVDKKFILEDGRQLLND